jgi:hypothetical protein
MKLRFIALIVAGLGAVAACSSSSSPVAPTPCNENPWLCGAGQTCWPSDQVGGFKCLNSGAAKKGEACQNTIGAPSCGDGLACLQLVGVPNAYCGSFCDPTNAAHACGASETCLPLKLGSSIEHVCASTAVPDAGPDANDTGTDTGSAVDASDTGTARETGADASEVGADAGETGTDAATGG